VSGDLARKVLQAAAESELVRAAGAVRADGGRRLALGQVKLRRLYAEEVSRLEGLGNTAEDWARVQVADGFDWRRVRRSHFHGDVVLGRFTRHVRLAEGVELPAGVEGGTLANCVIGHDALVRDVRLLANYVVGERAVLLDCGRILCDGPTAFGNGAVLPLGMEGGGRDVAVFAEIDVALAAAVARARSQPAALDQYARAVAEYVRQATAARGVVERSAVVRNTPELRNTYLGPFARVEGATLVADSTALSSEEEPVEIGSGACVSRTLLQWGGRAVTAALVERSVLTEHSHAERHGKVTDSLLGPNTGVGEGEVTACLLGPFVGFHHQALLIAALWPEGKGNISAGVQAGSNHTSRAPDQEFRPGEGAFLGLGAKIKFPADFSRAPYTVIACGVITLPQMLAFPFSLVNLPSVQRPGLSPALNEIVPAWLLRDNLFALKRNEGKYRARNRARRTRFDFGVFRPETVDLMRDACRRLEAVSAPRELYTDQDIDGLGKNFLLESNRRPAVDAYRYFVRYYALLGLKDYLDAVRREGQRPAADQILSTPSAWQPWEHQRRVLGDELGSADVASCLRLLEGMIEEVAGAVERSRARDDERGVRVIDDYAAVHPPAAQDPFVRQTREEARRLRQEVQELLAAWEAGGPPRYEGYRDAYEVGEQVA
jgi:hypothetical protein